MQLNLNEWICNLNLEWEHSHCGIKWPTPSDAGNRESRHLRSGWLAATNFAAVPRLRVLSKGATTRADAWPWIEMDCSIWFMVSFAHVTYFHGLWTLAVVELCHH